MAYPLVLGRCVVFGAANLLAICGLAVSLTKAVNSYQETTISYEAAK